MSILADMKMYAHFAWGLPGFLRHTITLEEAEAIVRRRLAERGSNFLRLVERGIFGYPHSPYLPLLKLAQVELGDIQNMVRDKGLEDTLHALWEAGVYVTFEEFKGREPMVRQVPGSLPLVLSGLRLALNTALLLTIAVELVAAKEGLGAMVWFAWETLRTGELYVSLAVTAALGVSINLILQRLMKHLVTWQVEREV